MRPRRERGAVAVEAALVICFVLVPLTLGIITYGYLLSFRQSISQAAAEGARAAAVAPRADAGARETIAFEAISDAMGMPCNSGQLACAAAADASCDDCLAVTVTYAYTADASKPILMPDSMVPSTLSYTAVSKVTQ